MKKPKPKLDAVELCKPLFERIHEKGVERHPRTWLMANEAAISAAIGRVTVHDAKMKEMVSLIVLRVLDCVKAP